MMAQSPRPPLLLVFVAILVPSLAAGQATVATPRIFEALAVAPGGTVCEIGAGDGELSLAAANLVGARGRVYSSELGADRIKTLRAKVDAAHQARVEVVAGEAERTNFPDGACDALLMRKVYHHFTVPAAMNASIAAALKAGGRLAVVDFAPPAAEGATPADRSKDGTHGVTSITVARELKAAGFEGIRTQAGTGRGFMVIAIKPGS
jgi:ubiquinone/menaquinone biosynthesis C-methylase UbiE